MIQKKLLRHGDVLGPIKIGRRIEGRETREMPDNLELQCVRGNVTYKKPEMQWELT